MSPSQRKQPEDPIVAKLVGQAKKAQLSRRGLFAAGGAVSLAALLAACSGGGGGGASSIRWGNWTYYLDYDEETGSYPTLDAFIEESGIDVQYFEDVDDNNTFYGKIKDQLALNQDVGYDTFVITDWMAARLIEAGEVQEFDHGKIPNISNLLPYMADVDFDNGRKASIPWQSGMAGLCYNKELYPKGIKTVSDLANPDLAGKVGVLSEMRDTLGLIMLDQGIDISAEWGSTEFGNALSWLDENLKSGQIARVKGNSYTQDLENGDTWAAICWSGDIATLNDEAGDKWEFLIPEAGATQFIDSFVMPNGTTQNDDVEALINYYYEPEVAAQVADYVWYVTPVAGAQEAMESVNPDQVNNPLIFPDEEMTSKIKFFRTLTSAEDNEFSTEFSKVLGN